MAIKDLYLRSDANKNETAPSSNLQLRSDVNKTPVFAYAQANAKIIVIARGFGQAQADIKQIYPNSPAVHASYATAIISDNPVAYWRLGDTSGTTAVATVGSDGTYIGPVTLGDTGALVGDSNKAIAVTPYDSDYVSIPTTNFPTGNADRTVELWFKTGDHSTVERLLFGYGITGQANQWFAIGFNGNGITLGILRDTTSIQGISPPIYYDNLYHHLVVTYTGATLIGEVWYDRRSLGTFSVTSLNTQSGNGEISPTGNSGRWFGRIDEVAVYNYVLSSTQIAYHYDTGTTIFGPTFAQTQADIKAIGRGFAQAQAKIKVIGNGFAQAQAKIVTGIVTYQVYAQAQADILQTYQGYAQAQAEIKQTYQSYAQAQADIKQTYQQYAQAQADILQTYKGYAQAQADIKAVQYGFANAQADIKAVGYGFGQAQTDIKQTYQNYAQAQAEIQQIYQSYAQAQAYILQPNVFAQAQAYISNPYVTDTFSRVTSSGDPFGPPDIGPDYDVSQSLTLDSFLDGSKINFNGDLFGLLVLSSPINIKNATASIDFITNYNSSSQIFINLRRIYESSGIFVEAAIYANPTPNEWGFILSDWDGVTSDQISQDLVLDDSTWYTLKIRALENLILAKIWKRSDSEPDWILSKGTLVNNLGSAEFGLSVANADTFFLDNWIVTDTSYKVFAQAQAEIVVPGAVTYNQFAQAQADIKAIGYGFGQCQSEIKQTYQTYAQTQADILQTYRGYAQSQADIKAVGYGFAQAACQTITNIVQIVDTFTRTTSSDFGTADVGGPWTIGLGTTSNFNTDGSVGTVSIPASTPQKVSLQQVSVPRDVAIKFHYSFDKIPTGGTFTFYANINAAPIDDNVTLARGYNFVVGLLTSGTLTAGVMRGQTGSLSNLTTYTVGDIWEFHGLFVKVSNNIYRFRFKTWKIGTAEPAWINPAGNANAPSLGHFSLSNTSNAVSNGPIIFTIDNLYVEESSWSEFGQAQAEIKQIYYGFGQAQAAILTSYQVYAQAQAEIKQTYQSYAQAQADIKAVEYGWGQAQVDIKQTYQVYAQAQAEIKQTYQSYGQAQADIKQTYQQYAQAQAEIKTTYQQYGQAQAHIIVLDNCQFGQSQTSILQVYYQHAQAQADILAINYGFGQSNARIIAFGVQGYGQAQTNIAGASYPSGQAQAQIRAFGVQGYGQSQADIKAVGQGYGQAQTNIKATQNSFAQAQADILVTQNRFAQAQTSIKATNFGFGQAQALIRTTNTQSAQAQADIKATQRQYGQAQARILTVYNASGQAQSDIKVTQYTFGQAQTYVKLIQYSFAQAQACVKGNAFGQAQTWILAKVNQYANAQALITSGVTYSGQANALIRRTEQVFGQAQVVIKTTRTVFAQSQTYIIVIGINTFAQAEAFIQKSAGYGQAAARITQAHTLESLDLSDRASMNLTLTDRAEEVQTTDTQMNLTLSDRNFELVLSDRLSGLTLQDSNYVGGAD